MPQFAKSNRPNIRLVILVDNVVIDLNHFNFDN